MGNFIVLLLPRFGLALQILICRIGWMRKNCQYKKPPENFYIRVYKRSGGFMDAFELPKEVEDSEPADDKVDDTVLDD